MSYKCKYCGKEFDNKCSLGGHVRFCKSNPRYIQNLKQLAIARANIKHDENGQIFAHKGEIYECQYCHKQFKLHGLKNHERYCNLNPNKDVYYKDRIYYSPGGWNKGLTKEIDNRIKNAAEKLHKRYEAGEIKTWCDGLTKETDDRIAKYSKQISKTAKEHGLSGGYRKGIGRGKKGWYKGIFCDSSWELAFVIYHIDHNIPIKRCEEKLQYEMNGKIRKYLPDFVVNDKIVEIKGWKDESALIKEQCFPEITIIDKNGIIPYIEYVVNKYGSNFINLYDK